MMLLMPSLSSGSMSSSEEVVPAAATATALKEREERTMSGMLIKWDRRLEGGRETYAWSGVSIVSRSCFY